MDLCYKENATAAAAHHLYKLCYLHSITLSLQYMQLHPAIGQEIMLLALGLLRQFEAVHALCTQALSSKVLMHALITRSLLQACMLLVLVVSQTCLPQHLPSSAMLVSISALSCNHFLSSLCSFST